MKHLFTAFIGILSLLLVLTTNTLHAQVRTKRFGQTQDLSAYGIASGNKQATPTLSLSAIDPAPLLLEDEAEALLGKPFRFGLNRAVDVDIIGAAAQTEQNGTRTYSYQITADGAFSLNLIFDRFQLKAGSKLYLYNSDRTMLIGPITDAQNPQSGGNPARTEFWTDLVQGSTLLIDLQEPIAGSGTSVLHLSSVVHAYKNLFPNTNKLFGQAGACHPNMVCYPDYQFQGDGVAMILTAGGGRACTGSMVTDMRQSFRSFFLTAFHCVDNGDNSLSAGEISNAQNWLVRFNYQSTTCTPGVDDLDVMTLNGTTFRAGLSNSDFALFELVQQVPADVNTTYNGWNRGAATTSNNFGIHHPRGDVKKISFTNANTELSGWNGSVETHVTSFWSTSGVTDPGSSGSPLFDGNRRIVGQLHGGPSFCGATGSSLRDYYGRVFTSWTGGGTNESRLSNWLDPNNTTNTTTNGVKPLVSGPAAFTTASSFSLNTGTSSITAWTVTGGAGIVSPMSGTGNIANLVALSNGSNLTITFGVEAGQSYPIRFAKVFDAIFTIPTLSGLAASPTTVCAGSPATFTATVGNFTGTYSFTLSNGSSPISGTASSTAFSQSITASGSGPQPFTLTVASSVTATTMTTTTLIVNAIPTIAITAYPSLNILTGQSTTLTASGASTYNWSNLASTTAITVSVAGPYSVTGTTNGCSGTATVTVNTFTILPPSITAQPASASTVCEGASVMVTVGVSGSISGYQWLKGGSPVMGQTTATLSLGNVQVSDAGVYSLSLTGPAGNTTSGNFTLTVNPVPMVTLTIPVGTTAQGSSGIALITLPPNGLPTTFQASGGSGLPGSSYERQILLDQINGYAIRQVDSNNTGIFSINRLGLFTLTVTGAGSCKRTVQWVVQAQ